MSLAVLFRHRTHTHILNYYLFLGKTPIGIWSGAASSVSGSTAMVLSANCMVCRWTVCSGSSRISPRMFIITRPTLYGRVRPEMHHHKTNVTHCNGSYALPWTEKIPWQHIQKTGVLGMFAHRRTSMFLLSSWSATINTRHTTKQGTTMFSVGDDLMIESTDQK
jgi:hypothetical protein